MNNDQSWRSSFRPALGKFLHVFALTGTRGLREIAKVYRLFRRRSVPYGVACSFAEQRAGHKCFVFRISRAPLHCVPASQKRASTPTRENRAHCHPRLPKPGNPGALVLGSPGLLGAAAREPAAQGEILFFSALTARLRSPRALRLRRAKRSSHPSKPKSGSPGTPVKSCPDTCVVDRSAWNSESNPRMTPPGSITAQ